MPAVFGIVAFLSGLLFGSLSENFINSGSESRINLEADNTLDGLELIRSPLNSSLQVDSMSRSYFALDKSGILIPETRNGVRSYKVDEAQHTFNRILETSKTALIVMDPWEDSGSKFLNSYYEEVLKDKIVPLVNKSLSINIPVIIFTNSPNEERDYGHAVIPELKNLFNNGKLHILYHQNVSSDMFSIWLKKHGVDTLIYSGLASNMCVLGRDLGMISMQIKGFKMYFIPEASAAVEFGNSWRDQSLHKATTILISQGVGEIIKLEEFLNI
jgi:nicotinamidase-related amidase